MNVINVCTKFKNDLILKQEWKHNQSEHFLFVSQHIVDCLIKHSKERNGKASTRKNVFACQQNSSVCVSFLVWLWCTERTGNGPKWCKLSPPDGMHLTTVLSRGLCIILFLNDIALVFLKASCIISYFPLVEYYRLHISLPGHVKAH